MVLLFLYCFIRCLQPFLKQQHTCFYVCVFLGELQIYILSQSCPYLNQFKVYFTVYNSYMKTVIDFIFGGFRITADGDCRHEIKRCLLLGRKVMTNLDSILKSRDITLPTKVCLVKASFSSSHVWM